MPYPTGTSCLCRASFACIWCAPTLATAVKVSCRPTHPLSCFKLAGSLTPVTNARKSDLMMWTLLLWSMTVVHGIRDEASRRNYSYKVSCLRAILKRWEDKRTSIKASSMKAISLVVQFIPTVIVLEQVQGYVLHANGVPGQNVASFLSTKLEETVCYIQNSFELYQMSVSMLSRHNILMLSRHNNSLNFPIWNPKLEPTQ